MNKCQERRHSLREEVEEISESLSHWKRWKWYYIVFGAVGKVSVVALSYLAMGLTMSHFTYGERRVEAIERVIVSVGGSTAPYSLDSISYFVKVEGTGRERLAHFGRCTETEFDYIEEDDDKTLPFIHCVYEWEWPWKIPKPRSAVLIRAKKSRVVMK